MPVYLGRKKAPEDLRPGDDLYGGTVIESVEHLPPTPGEIAGVTTYDSSGRVEFHALGRPVTVWVQ